MKEAHDGERRSFSIAPDLRCLVDRLVFADIAPSILARPLPRLRLTLRAWAVVIAILATDFAINALVERCYPGLFVRLVVYDTATILLCVGSMLVSQPTPRNLWALGFGVGCLGLMLMPSVSGH